jgi:uncharacterized protein YdhG (YjbR/CyaY superfamily)
MQSKAETVDAYIAEAEPKRQAAMQRLRALCVEHLPGYVEGMKWGMAAYSQGEQYVAFASQKQYLSLYGLRQAVARLNAAEQMGGDPGKGCFRYSNPDRIDFDLVARLLDDIAATPDEVSC